MANNKDNTPSGEKRRRGPKSKYNESFGPMIEAEAAVDFHNPMSNDSIAKLCGVDQSTVQRWYKEYPQFMESVKRAKGIADARVKRSMYERALGYSHPEVIVHKSGNGVIKTPVIKHYPPDVMAGMYWLNNRCPDEFKQRQEMAVSGSVIPILNITVDAAAPNPKPQEQEQQSNEESNGS